MALIWLILSMFIVPESIHVEGQYQRQNQIFIYGSYHEEGYLLSHNLNGEIIFELTYQRSDATEMIYLADVNDGIIVVARNSQIDWLIKYDYQGQFMEEIPLEQKMEDYHNHHGYLIIEDDDQLTYIDNNLNVYHENPIKTTSDDAMEIQYQGEAFINGESVSSLLLNDIGAYEIQIVDGDYQYHQTLVIYPRVFYHNGIDEFLLTDAIILYEPIQMFSVVDQMILNGLPYENQLIHQTGEYHLSLIHNDTLLKEIHFSIHPSIEGIQEGVVDSQSFFVFGDAYLNQAPIQGYCLIDEPGEYELIIYYNDHVYQRYQFQIIDSKNDDAYMIYLVVGIFLVVLLIKFLKK